MGFALDRTLIDRAAEGDSDALDAFIKALRPHVERQLLRYPVTDDDRRDLLQTTLMQVIRRLDSFRGDSSFSTWLFRVTANEALMLMRSQRRHRTRLVEGLEFEDLAAIPDTQDAEQVDVVAADRQRDARVREALAALPADYRDVVVAHYHMDLGLEEIAGRFALSESAVRSRLHRARTRLRTILAATPVGAEAREDAVRQAATERTTQRSTAERQVVAHARAA